jgi:hypothetical protein
VRTGPLLRLPPPVPRQGIHNAELFRFGLHALLFFILTFAGKRIYRRIAFRKIRGVVAAVDLPSRPPLRLVTIASGVGTGLAMMLVGLVMATALVGWVFAVARLNAEVELLRSTREVPSPETPPQRGG